MHHVDDLFSTRQQRGRTRFIRSLFSPGFLSARSLIFHLFVSFAWGTEATGEIPGWRKTTRLDEISPWGKEKSDRCKAFYCRRSAFELSRCPSRNYGAGTLGTRTRKPLAGFALRRLSNDPKSRVGATPWSSGFWILKLDGTCLKEAQVILTKAAWVSSFIRLAIFTLSFVHRACMVIATNRV